MRRYYDVNEDYERGYCDGRRSVLEESDNFDEDNFDESYELGDVDTYRSYAMNKYSFTVIDEDLKDYLKSLCKGGIWVKNMGWSGIKGRNLPFYSWKFLFDENCFIYVWINTAKDGFLKIDYAIDTTSYSGKISGTSFKSHCFISSEVLQKLKDKIKDKITMYSDMDKLCHAFSEIMKISKEFKKTLKNNN